MKGINVMDALLQENGSVRDRLLDLEEALTKVTVGSYSECRRAVYVMKNLCRFFEQDDRHLFHEKTFHLYSSAGEKVPGIQNLLEELYSEEKRLSRVLHKFHNELNYFNTSGQLRDLPMLGRELCHLLRRHLEHEQHDLYPVLLANFQMEDWKRLDEILIPS